MDRIAIVGCGYVGSELARTLAGNKRVYAVSRTGVSIPGVESLERDVTQDTFSIPAVDRVYYLVSAGERSVAAYRAAYTQGLTRTLEATEPETEFVYASSTGVYGVTDGSWVDASTTPQPTSERGEVLLEAEERVLANGGTVVRFAGLYGPDRLGVDRYLGDVEVPTGYLNLLHRDDAARSMVAAASGPSQCYLSVDDEPIHRHDLARWLAERLDRPVGRLSDTPARTNKRCRNDRLRSTGWRPEFPTFREGYEAVLSTTAESPS